MADCLADYWALLKACAKAGQWVELSVACSVEWWVDSWVCQWDSKLAENLVGRLGWLKDYRLAAPTAARLVD